MYELKKELCSFQDPVNYTGLIFISHFFVFVNAEKRSKLFRTEKILLQHSFLLSSSLPSFLFVYMHNFHCKFEKENHDK